MVFRKIPDPEESMGTESEDEERFEETDDETKEEENVRREVHVAESVKLNIPGFFIELTSSKYTCNQLLEWSTQAYHHFNDGKTPERTKYVG